VVGVVVASLVGVAAIPVQPNEAEVRKAMPVTQAKRIRKLAEEYGVALAVGNYAWVVDLMYPTLVGDRWWPPQDDRYVARRF
jgi:hypothetical protein